MANVCRENEVMFEISINKSIKITQTSYIILTLAECYSVSVTVIKGFDAPCSIWFLKIFK